MYFEFISSEKHIKLLFEPLFVESGEKIHAKKIIFIKLRVWGTMFLGDKDRKLNMLRRSLINQNLIINNSLYE